MAALLPLFRHAIRYAPPASDGALLDRFAAGRDEDAFAELVRRHGPVVYRVCRRLVGSDAADDAFQATFLVLANRLDTARAAASVVGWLVGVAGRVGRQMRRAAGRRARHETLAAANRPGAEPDNPIDRADQFRVLDEELARLPARLRDPIVLCHLQGRTQDEAAAELGRDARTLRRRLERAKQVLRARLERRGVVPAVALALVVGAEPAAANLPRELTARTLLTVFDFLTGGSGIARSAPVALAKGVATTMVTRKLMLSMAALAVGLVGFGVVLADDGPPRPTPAPVPPLALTDKGRKDDAARLKAQAKGLAGMVAKGERTILIEAMCIDVPAGFCKESGLEEEQIAWSLSPREARMFNALIRAAKEKGALEVITRPQMMVYDTQTAFAQVGQNVPYVASQEVKVKNGQPEVLRVISHQEVGVKLKVAPTISADGKSIRLLVDTQSTEVSPTPVDLGNGLTAPGFDSQSLSMTTVIPDTGTAVIRAETTIKLAHRKHLERVWVLPAHIVRGKAKPPADAKPAAAVPPAATVPSVPIPAPPAILPPPQK